MIKEIATIATGSYLINDGCFDEKYAKRLETQESSTIDDLNYSKNKEMSGKFKKGIGYFLMAIGTLGVACDLIGDDKKK